MLSLTCRTSHSVGSQVQHPHSQEGTHRKARLPTLASPLDLSPFSFSILTCLGDPDPQFLEGGVWLKFHLQRASVEAYGHCLGGTAGLQAWFSTCNEMTPIPMSHSGGFVVQVFIRMLPSKPSLCHHMPSAVCSGEWVGTAPGPG